MLRRTAPAVDDALHADPLVRRILAARGVTAARELDFALAALPRPDTLPDTCVAVERLRRARARGEHVRVVGDYDCDGATSTALAVTGLSAFGFEHVSFRVPERFRDGYGLTPNLVDEARARGADVLLTTDNGISAHAAAARARELGIDLVVTDHHLPDDTLPDAIAIVNPNRADSTFPSGNLAGVGVMFYLLCALRAGLLEDEPTVAEVPLAPLLDLVAVGTVADMVVLDGVNRILVEQGLRRIRAGRARAGLAALLEVSGTEARHCSTSDIGYRIAPRLNAAGRIDDMAVGVRCLLATDPHEASALATRLDRFNSERRDIERGARDAALERVERYANIGDRTRFSTVLFDADWHAGVIGLVAGRLVQRLNRPTVVFAADGPDGMKGSARSVPGVHLRDALAAVDRAHPGLVGQFGGHAMAAGLSLPRQGLDTFVEAFERTVHTMLDGRRPERRWLVDGTVPLAQRTLAFAELLERLLPWGQGCEAPLFADRFRVEVVEALSNGRHLRLMLSDASGGAAGTDASAEAATTAAATATRWPAILFDAPHELAPGDVFEAVYALGVNRYRGRTAMQIELRHLLPSGVLASIG